MKHVTSDRPMTPERAERLQAIRGQIVDELPELVRRYQNYETVSDVLAGLVTALKSAREAQGLALENLAGLSEPDRVALAAVEVGRPASVTFETLTRYADAVGKRLVLSLADRPPA